MSVEHCGKHDITYPPGGECWCCEEQKLNAKPGAREAAYKDPEFLAKRGGLDKRAAAHSAVMQKLEALTPEQVDQLLRAAGVQLTAGGMGLTSSKAPVGVRRVVA